MNWRIKALLPVAGVLLAGLFVFVWVTLSFEHTERRAVILVAAGGAVAICAVMLVALALLIQKPLAELQEKIARLLERMGPRMEKYFPELAERFYSQIRHHPNAFRVFTGDEAQIGRLKQTLQHWVGGLFCGR